MKTVPSNLCRIPWTGFSNEPDGRVQPCCLYKGYIEQDSKPLYIQTSSVKEIFHSDFMKNLRQKFRNNERPAECQTCWTDEDNGYRSKRVIYNNDIKQEYDWETEPDNVVELQLIINNSCNLKCRSCTPSHSTQWQAEFKALTGITGYPMPFKQSGDEDGKLWSERFEWYKDLNRLEIVGGEPFYVKQWHTILNELVDMGYSKNIDLTMTTNCTLFYPELINKIASNFKSVSIGLSIDGTESVYEYVRHPGKWSVAYDNMKKYYEYVDKINIQINITISWLNAFNIPKLHKLTYTEFPKFRIWNNIVHSPEHLALWATTDTFKNDLENNWAEFTWDKNYESTMESILKFMRSKDILETQFLKNLEILYATDKFRNEILPKSIPDISKYIVDKPKL